MYEDLSKIQELAFELKALLPDDKKRALDNLLFGRVSESRKGDTEKGVVQHPKLGRLLTPKKASQITGYTTAWLLQLAKSGRLRYVRPKRKVLYYEQDILSYMN
ncbi:MAG: helix-turn-helix domain-containing protein [Bacteroidales bacterium]|nr:helix-turn-helix domain-containing protein [Bacteroidales bacterium]